MSLGARACERAATRRGAAGLVEGKSNGMWKATVKTTSIIVSRYDHLPSASTARRSRSRQRGERCVAGAAQQSAIRLSLM